ncbi:Protein phosphatase 1 regulatory subunit 37 [Hypsibius exemplaris]|uniref:Protein phosphatase 1 regulatory subunit 37 n=1 Tax=Hypsibius exemplaris TaxID=2072580 RepID=A0A1W0X8C1_HYPEX|nr:Protein phosphatase 1 regulatory subunit 37 [Hypsibius exemplaris]
MPEMASIIHRPHKKDNNGEATPNVDVLLDDSNSYSLPASSTTSEGGAIPETFSQSAYPQKIAPAADRISGITGGEVSDVIEDVSDSSTVPAPLTVAVAPVIADPVVKNGGKGKKNRKGVAAAKVSAKDVSHVTEMVSDTSTVSIAPSDATALVTADSVVKEVKRVENAEKGDAAVKIPSQEVSDVIDDASDTSAVSAVPVDATATVIESLTEKVETEEQCDAVFRHPLDIGAKEEGVDGAAYALDMVQTNPPDPLTASGRKRKNMRVSFRSEEDKELVTDYVSPPDPWRFADESSTQNVLKAYAQMCLTNNVQPLPKVLESIKRNPGNRQRSGVFDLSGETIDLALVDTLEAIFMRMSFEELNLDGCLSDDELAVALMDMLEYYQMADKLVVSSNRKLQFRGWLAIAKNLKNCCLYYLDARGCPLQDQSASLISRALRCGTNLVTLHLENCSLSGRPAFLLISALQFSETVQELFLGDNKLTPNDMIHLASALKHGWRIRVLDLRNNLLMNSGAAHLLESVDDSSVRALVLFNTGITFQIGKTLARTLIRSRNLETLNIGMNDLTDETIFAIKESLITNRSVRRLGLQAAKLSDEGCIALAEFLADHPRFLRLDIRHNDIRGAGWLALSHAAKISPSLIRVDMSYDMREIKHPETIRDSLQQITSACLNNLDKFEKSLLPQAIEEEPVFDETVVVNGSGSPDDNATETPPLTNGATDITVTAPPPEDDQASSDAPIISDSVPLSSGIAVDMEFPNPDYPEFIGITFAEAEADDKDNEPDIDIPRKKCHPGRRRSSITSVTATGPLSICDRLNDELFPVRAGSSVCLPPYNTPVIKGRFQISLVKAGEKLYQSVQSVLSPTNSQAAGTPIGGTTNATAADSVDAAPKPDPKSLFNWRATFRRGSKEIPQVDLPVLAGNGESAGNKSPERTTPESSPLKIST